MRSFGIGVIAWRCAASGSFCSDQPWVSEKKCLLQIAWMTKRIFGTQLHIKTTTPYQCGNDHNVHPMSTAKCSLETSLRNLKPNRSLSGGVGAMREKKIRIVHNANYDVGAECCCNFSFPPPFALLGGCRRPSSPAPPSEWLGSQSIYARVPKPVSVQFALHCASLEEKRPRNEIKVIRGVCSTLRFA